MHNEPIKYFNLWCTIPVALDIYSVRGVIDALNRHPMAQDETAQDYIMPVSRYHKHPGRFSIYGENQDCYYCFVHSADADKQNPPVYCESSYDLSTDYGINSADILGKYHALIASSFDLFLWHVIGRHLCLRMERAGYFKPNVTGIHFEETRNSINLSFRTISGRDFFAGFTPLFIKDTVVIHDWGAVFLTIEAKHKFIDSFGPKITREWA